MSDPDAVFDDHAINEYWWEWLRENDVSAGDALVVETETTSWATPMTVTEAHSDEVRFESAAGSELAIVTYSKPATLEPACPIVRRWDGFTSEGVVERVELYSGGVDA